MLIIIIISVHVCVKVVGEVGDENNCHKLWDYAASWVIWTPPPPTPKSFRFKKNFFKNKLFLMAKGVKYSAQDSSDMI